MDVPASSSELGRCGRDLCPQEGSEDDRALAGVLAQCLTSKVMLGIMDTDA